MSQCICKWFDHDTLVVDKTCTASDHGNIQQRLRYSRKWFLNQAYGPFEQTPVLFEVVSKKLYPFASSDEQNR